MVRFIKAVFLLPLAAILVAIGVANRQSVTLFFEPWNRTEAGLSLTMPLFILLFGIFALGILVGSFLSWMSHGKERKARRQVLKERDGLAKECASLKAQLPPLSSLPSS